jgi:pimeloyl-ACP methyl ester carboxylesterase
MSDTLVEEKRSRRNVPKVVRRLLLLLAVLYVLPLLVLGAFQRQLVFGAFATHGGSPVEAPPGAQRLWLCTSASDRFEAYYGHALLPNGAADFGYSRRPTLLFFGGKGASLAGELGLFQLLRRLDTNVLVPEYPGFGQSGGQESEPNCFAAATTAYRFLRNQPDVDQKRLVIAGYSLGSGVAVDLAARELTARQPVAGLALFAAYTSMADMGHHEYPIYPAWLLRLILRSPFDSAAKMPKITCPVLLVHSRADTLIPYQMSDTLTALCRGPMTRLTITHASHAGYFSSAETAVFPALRKFLERTPHETQSQKIGSPAEDRLFPAHIVYEEPRSGAAAPRNADNAPASCPQNPNGGADGSHGENRENGAGA